MSAEISNLMPNIMRGVELDFFASKAITQTQFLMVAAIHAFRACTMGVLAKNLNVKMPTATGIADRLARGGYVKRFHPPEDRRKVLITLTPEGERFVENFQKVMKIRWAEVLHHLNGGELRSLYRAVHKLGERLKDQASGHAN